ncbi:MAG: DMT family transporter [Rhodospirillales bacterium]|nr:DMT family transporter [Rhodospirillales bacterium]
MLKKVPANLQGIAFMLLSSICAAAMHALVKFVAFELHPFQIFCIRQWFAVILLMPIFINIGFGTLKSEKIGLHMARGVTMTVGGMSWFWALSLVPLAKVTALNLSAALFTVLGAILFLKESSEWRRWMVLIFGFIGVIVIIQPGSEVISFGVILIISTRLFPATSRIISKVLSQTDRTPTIVVYGALGMAILSLLPALIVWQAPDLRQLLFIGLIAFFGTLSQLAMVQAYKAGDMGAVEPIHFIRLIWAALFGFIIFGEVPGIWVWIGAVMIIIALSYLAKGEARK